MAGRICGELFELSKSPATKVFDEDDDFPRNKVSSSSSNLNRADIGDSPEKFCKIFRASLRAKTWEKKSLTRNKVPLLLDFLQPTEFK